MNGLLTKLFSFLRTNSIGHADNVQRNGKSTKNPSFYWLKNVREVLERPRARLAEMMRAPSSASSCIFCQIARSSTSTVLLHSDEKVVVFQDINPSAFRHYLVIPIEHIPTVRNLQRRDEDFALVSHMLDVGQTLLRKDAPNSKHFRFGFHQPPFNSVDHLHLHCLALPFIPSWKSIKYLSLGPLGGFIEAEKLLEKLKPLSPLTS